MAAFHCATIRYIAVGADEYHRKLNAQVLQHSPVPAAPLQPDVQDDASLARQDALLSRNSWLDAKLCTSFRPNHEFTNAFLTHASSSMM